jgi:uncharacterized cupredoxin-like copper-binding protein
MRFSRSICVILSLALLSFGVAACGDDGDSAESTAVEPATEATGNVVNVQLGENGNKYFVKVDRDTVKAGKTTFVIDNVGTIHHEMAIYKTDIAADKLPLTAEGTVDEEKAGLLAEAVYATPVRGDEDHRIRDGRGVNFTIDLQPGKYVLLCNLRGHYKAGQFVAFTVT